ncbi:outer membrane protein [Rhizobium sp. PP-F2F-G36]|nr:outer membrane protein [Rhizobium sp. PP-F2F-G36]
MTWLVRIFACVATGLLPASVVFASDSDHFWSGNWSLSLGGAVANGPAFEGAKNRKFLFSPIISVGRQGQIQRFSSRNDSASFALYDSAIFRAGIAGKLITGRDNDTSEELEGLSEIKSGGEAGVFVDVYPTDGLRARAEIRHGIRSHHGTVADLSVDAYTDVAPTVRISAGPRATYATAGFGQAYYGVDTKESFASGLTRFNSSSGWQSIGIGGAVNWKATDKIDTSLFAEYKRIVGIAADSSLVRQKGSDHQLLVGVSATYRFDFTLD